MTARIKIEGLRSFRKDLSSRKAEIIKTVQEASNESFNLPYELRVTTGKGRVKGFDALQKKLLKDLNAAHLFAVKAVAKELKIALDDAMNNPIWNWNGDTRDIVDTGALRDSLQLYVDSDADIHILYNLEYAAIVHYGGYFNPYGNPQVKLYYPARPWIDSVLNGGGPVEKFMWEGPYEKAFTTYMNRKL